MGHGIFKVVNRMILSYKRHETQSDVLFHTGVRNRTTIVGPQRIYPAPPGPVGIILAQRAGTPSVTKKKKKKSPNMGKAAQKGKMGLLESPEQKVLNLKEKVRK